MRAALFLLLLVLAACSPPLEPELEGEPGGPRAGPIAVAPPRIEYRTTRGLRAPALDCAAVATRVAALLAERGGFERGIPLGEPAQAGPARDQALRAAARKAGARWLLEPVLTRGQTRWAGHNGLIALKFVNLVLCAFLIFPAVDPPNWVLPSEHYAVDLEGAWRLTDLQGGAGGKGELRAGAEAAFADFSLGFMKSRPFFIVGFLRVPECLDPDDWAEVAEELRPDLEESLARRLVLAAEGARPR